MAAMSDCRGSCCVCAVKEIAQSVVARVSPRTFVARCEHSIRHLGREGITPPRPEVTMGRGCRDRVLGLAYNALVNMPFLTGLWLSLALHLQASSPASQTPNPEMP